MTLDCICPSTHSGCQCSNASARSNAKSTPTQHWARQSGRCWDSGCHQSFIAGRLRKLHPDDQTMWVCTETIYQALFVQAKGELKQHIKACLRQGRAVRKPRRPKQSRQRFHDPMVMISDRPATVEDRAVPGHWEGDLIMGAGNKTAIGTLVERSTRYVMLLPLVGCRSRCAGR